MARRPKVQIPRRAILVGILSVGSLRCRERNAITQAPAASAPRDEVWISKEQLESAGIQEGLIESRPTRTSLTASGRITFDDLRVAHVFSPVTGRVTNIRARLGEWVKKGDLLTSIVSPDIGQSSSDLAKAEADVIAAEHDFKRKKELFARHAAAAADVEASEDNYRRTVAERARAFEKVKLLHAGDDPSAVTQGYRLAAPIDGEVIARMVNPGVEVQGQYGGGGQVNELFTIGELDVVWLLADVFEMDLPRIEVGARVTATVVTFPGRTFEGKVDWISGGIDPTMRTAKVRCVLPNPDRILRPEMFATVKIAVEQSERPSVPRAAIMHLGGDTYLWADVGLTADGKLRLKKTRVDADDSAGTEWVPISDAVATDTRVITKGGIVLLGML